MPVICHMPLLGSYHPAIGMRYCVGAAVEFSMQPDKGRSMFRSSSILDDQMLVDSTDDDWHKLHDVRVNGQVI